MSFLCELGYIGVKPPGECLPHSIVVIDTSLDLDIILFAQVYQLFPDFRHKLHVAEVDEMGLAELLGVFGLTKCLEDLEEGDVIALAGDKGLPRRHSLFSFGGWGQKHAVTRQ